MTEFEIWDGAAYVGPETLKVLDGATWWGVVDEVYGPYAGDVVLDGPDQYGDLWTVTLTSGADAVLWRELDPEQSQDVENHGESGLCGIRTGASGPWRTESFEVWGYDPDGTGHHLTGGAEWQAKYSQSGPYTSVHDWANVVRIVLTFWGVVVFDIDGITYPTVNQRSISDKAFGRTTLNPASDGGTWTPIGYGATATWSCGLSSGLRPSAYGAGLSESILIRDSMTNEAYISAYIGGDRESGEPNQGFVFNASADGSSYYFWRHEGGTTWTLYRVTGRTTPDPLASGTRTVVWSGAVGETQSGEGRRWGARHDGAGTISLAMQTAGGHTEPQNRVTVVDPAPLSGTWVGLGQGYAGFAQEFSEIVALSPQWQAQTAPLLARDSDGSYVEVATMMPNA